MRTPKYFLEKKRIKETAKEFADAINDAEEVFEQLEQRRKRLICLREMMTDSEEFTREWIEEDAEFAFD
jgi:hypothetical protein